MSKECLDKFHIALGKINKVARILELKAEAFYEIGNTKLGDDLSVCVDNLLQSADDIHKELAVRVQERENPLPI